MRHMSHVASVLKATHCFLVCEASRLRADGDSVNVKTSDVISSGGCPVVSSCVHHGQCQGCCLTSKLWTLTPRCPRQCWYWLSPVHLDNYWWGQLTWSYKMVAWPQTRYLCIYLLRYSSDISTMMWTPTYPSLYLRSLVLQNCADIIGGNKWHMTSVKVWRPQSTWLACRYYLHI